MRDRRAIGIALPSIYPACSLHDEPEFRPTVHLPGGPAPPDLMMSITIYGEYVISASLLAWGSENAVLSNVYGFCRQQWLPKKGAGVHEGRRQDE
jgi:hypothetical protein